MKSKIIYSTIVAIILGACVSLVSCSKDDAPISEKPSGELTINEWIDQIMRENYLWNEEIPESGKLDYSANPNTFFESLLSLKDGKTRPGEPHYYYSTLVKNQNYGKSTRTRIEPDNTYGMEFQVFNFINNDGSPLGYIWARIIYILPNSPAAEAGLKRGDWIVGIGGVNNITVNDLSSLLSGGNIALSVGWQNPRKVDLMASRPVENNPLFYHTVFSFPGKKIGYLVYNSFVTGLENFIDRTYDEQLKSLFLDFRNQGVNEFILDLRYNVGGALISANVLAGLLVPEQSKQEIFGILTDNKGEQTIYRFNSEGQTTSLNLNSNRLFVLTSFNTASASEMVINGLEPFMNVVLVGGITDGKNVGSYLFSDNKYEWDIRPITFRVTSSRTDVDYSQGLLPDYFADEFDFNQNVTDELLPLGDPNEFMLSQAIGLITGTQAATKSQSTPVLIPRGQLINSSLERFRTNGVLVYPGNKEKTKATPK